MMAIDVKSVGQGNNNVSRFATHALWISVAGATIATIVNTRYAATENLYRMESKFDPQCDAWDNSAVIMLTGLVADRSSDATVRARRGFYLLQRARSNCRFRELTSARHDYNSITNLISSNGK